MWLGVGGVGVWKLETNQAGRQTRNDGRIPVRKIRRRNVPLTNSASVHDSLPFSPATEVECKP